jgi:hypothetical protein
VADKAVPDAVRTARERELLDAVCEAGVPAAELFGDAAVLAAEDAAELATVDEAVRTSEAGGLKPALREVGGRMLAAGAVAVLSMAVRRGWSVDVDAASVLLAASLLVVLVGWAVGRALYLAGRSAATLGVGLGVLAVAAGGIAVADSLGPDRLLARAVPVPLMALVLLTPGVLMLVASSRMAQPTLQGDWDDAAWLRRFRGGLRARLVPADTARGHVVEVEQAIAAGAGSAFAEFGHPLVLAEELAQADRTARARRWWLTTVAGSVVPLGVAALVIVNDSWGPLTVPIAAFLLLVGLATSAAAWGRRPWAQRR